MLQVSLPLEKIEKKIPAIDVENGRGDLRYAYSAGLGDERRTPFQQERRKAKKHSNSEDVI